MTLHHLNKVRTGLSCCCLGSSNPSVRTTSFKLMQGFMYSMPALLLLAAASAVVPVVAAFQTGQALAADRHGMLARLKVTKQGGAAMASHSWPCAHDCCMFRVGEVPQQQH